MPIGIGGGIALAGLAGAGATAASSLIGSQTSASQQRRGLAAIRRMYAQGRDVVDPFISGTAPTLAPLTQYAQGTAPSLGPLSTIAGMSKVLDPALLSALGLAGGTASPWGSTPIGGGGANLLSTFQPTMAQLAATPGYQFTLQQGMLAASNPMIAQGLGGSGALGKGLTNYASGLAAQTYQQQLDNYLRQNAQAYNMLMGPIGTSAQAAQGLGGITATAGAQLGDISSATGRALLGASTQTGANLATGFTNIGQTLGGGIAGAGQAIGQGIAGLGAFGLPNNFFTGAGAPLFPGAPGYPAGMGYPGAAAGGAGLPWLQSAGTAATSPAAVSGGVLSPIAAPMGANFIGAPQLPTADASLYGMF